jgi:hypothetical protein
MTFLNQRRKGFALAVAIGAIVIIGALIAGVFFASTQEFRIGRNTLLQTRALTAAEQGLYTVASLPPAGLWSSPLYTGMVSGATAAPIQILPGDGSVDTVRVTKLNDLNFLVVSEGRAGATFGAQARRRIAGLVTLQVPLINIRGALTTQGGTSIGGSSNISGNDSTFAGWGCGLPGAALPGIAMPDSSQITQTGCPGFNCIAGSPKILEDSIAGDTATYFTFGDTDWQELTSMANKVVPMGPWSGLGPTFTAGGACDTANPYNWGDPKHVVANTSCQSYFPIIYAPGNLKITGGVAQGLLLVEGNLDVQGGAEFFGPVIVRGNLSTQGTGGHFMGGVMAANVALNQNAALGNAVIQYSSCAISKALAGSALPVLARGRSWVELY